MHESIENALNSCRKKSPMVKITIHVRQVRVQKFQKQTNHWLVVHCYELANDLFVAHNNYTTCNFL